MTKACLTLLQGKLVDYYIEMDEETRDDLGRLKALLMTKAGLVRDSLASGQIFMMCTHNRYIQVIL